MVVEGQVIWLSLMQKSQLRDQTIWQTLGKYESFCLEITLWFLEQNGLFHEMMKIEW